MQILEKKEKERLPKETSFRKATQPHLRNDSQYELMLKFSALRLEPLLEKKRNSGSPAH